MLSQIASNTLAVLSLVPGGTQLVSSFHARREDSRRNEELERCPIIQGPVRQSDVRVSIPGVELTEGCSNQQIKSRLFALPAEIRNQIMVEAFGQRTLHMSLELQHPFALTTHKSSQRRHTHAGIRYLRPALNSHLRTDLPKKWTWFGCVCHQFAEPDEGELPGRLRCLGVTAESDPGTDYCMEGLGYCNTWPVASPTKCQVGIMGWLLACRQSYQEAMHILYGTNTIRIASPALHQNLQKIFSKATLSLLTSLDLVWDPEQLSLASGFVGENEANVSHQTRPPVFPSMIRLHISFRGGNDIQRDEALGVDWRYRNKEQLSQALNNKVFPTVDSLVQRLVPSTSDVTFQCPNWTWYKLMDSFLVENQGLKATKLQRGDLGGLKCWRQTTAELLAPSIYSCEIRHCSGTEEAENSSVSGIWVHIGSKDIQLGNNTTYDHARCKLYGLREFEFCSF
ncbi:unnamed protein product [Clonostachys solani]|uniref:DUF7730 domain-containing protein n=1 Tax=Clonostachys solani TaxID=160281 RepID=A0A9P0EB63_9HYPO|nr:unnamed protein product [Clonostachys solani]